MKFDEMMVFFDFKMTNIARALHVGRQTIYNWKIRGKIPFEKQCVIEILSNGQLKADREDNSENK